MTNKESAAATLLIVFGLAALIVVVVLALTSYSNGAVPKQPSQNSLGTVSYTENPIAYIAGNVTDVSEVEGNLNLRVQPLGTYALFDQSILFCGMPIDKFEGVSQPMLIAYEKKSHRRVAGVGCHEIVNAFSLTPKEGMHQ